MKVLLLDNYDSFTYNLAHRLRDVGVTDLTVLRNDKVEVHDLDRYSHIVLSPGPGIPSEAGKMMEVIAAHRERASILGVCLGHQAIAESCGGKLVNMGAVVHGKQKKITVDTSYTLFAGLSNRVEVGLYHSWIVDADEFPEELRIIAHADDGAVMALRHKKFPLYGVQFHPESVMTESGYTMLENWISEK